MSNLKLIVTWDVNRVGLSVCRSPFWWLGLSWIFVGSAWAPGPPGCQQWGHRGLGQQLFLKLCLGGEQGLQIAQGESARLFFNVIYFYFYLWSQFLPSMKSWDREPYPWCRWKMMQCWHSLCLLVSLCPTFNSGRGVTVPGMCRNILFV